MSELVCQRDRFSIPSEVHYLNCAYMGPLPRVAQEAGVAGLARKAVPTGIAPRDFFEDAERARALFARVIRAPDASGVAITPAVSYGSAIVARNLAARPGGRIVMVGEQFPSNVYAWRSLASRAGLDLVVVDPPDSRARGQAWNTAVLEAIGTDTVLVALPQVHWTDGTRFDLEAIGAAARRQGAAFVVDATQSAGAMPFDVGRIGADAVFCAGYKWLLGPYGIGFTWLGERFADAVPLEETWIGRGGSEDFQGLVQYRDDYQPGAARFDVGERSNFILLPMLVASLELITGWGPDAIQAYCRTLVAPAVEQAVALGFTAEDPAWRGAHLFGLRAPADTDLRALQAALAAHNVHVSLRGSAVRISPNVYNDAGDVEAFAGALRAALAQPRRDANSAARSSADRARSPLN